MDRIGVEEPRNITPHARLVSRDGPFDADIVLYAADTPNTWKVAGLLEELKVRYDVVPIDLASNEQKEEWFMMMNPNGRTPAMLDRSSPDEPFTLFESGAMMLYLCDKFGSSLLPKDPRRRSEVEQWLMWQMSALGPMLGNCMYFKRIAAPTAEDIAKLEFGINRYNNESVRLLKVLDTRLADREYLCGPAQGEFSIADIACFGYAQSHWWAGIDVTAMAGLRAWLDRLAAKSAVLEGLKVPSGKANVMVMPTDENKQLRAQVEENASKAGRPHFGWRDLQEVRQGPSLSGIFDGKL